MTSESRTDGPMETILLEGDLTIASVRSIKSRLAAEMEKETDVRITIGPVEGVDLTVLQVLCAFHRSAVLSGKRVVLDDAAAPEFGTLKKKAGFLRHQGCRANPTHNCLWLKEGN